MPAFSTRVLVFVLSGGVTLRVYLPQRISTTSTTGVCWILTHRLVKLISLSNFSRAIAMVCRRVYATLILIGQSNLDRPIRADETKQIIV